MTRVRTETRTVYIGKPGKTRLTKRWAYIDAAWHSMRKRCDCEPAEFDRNSGECIYRGGDCEFHRRMRNEGEQHIGREGDYYEVTPPRSGREYFKRCANRLASIYAAQDRKAGAR